jgi:hypothetical protein
MSEVTIMTCGPSTMKCKCNCPEYCEHIWDGEQEETRYENGASSVSVTCSRCGMSAMQHDMLVMP